MKIGVLFFWLVIVVAAFVRVLFSLVQYQPDIGACLKQDVHGEAQVSADPERKEAGQVMVLAVRNMFIASSSEPCANDLLIRVKTKLYPRFQYGDVVEFEGKLSAPFNFKSDTGRSFDYKGYLAKDDIYYEIKSGIVMNVTQSAEGLKRDKSASSVMNFISSSLFSLKRSFVSHLEKTLGEPHAALAAGLVVGEKSALGAQLLEDFRTVGLIHIVVLSGFNITVVADALRRALSRLPRIWGIVIGGVGMLLFGVLVGGGATVVRSCFMASIALVADVTRRSYNVLRALLFAALVMLIQNPTILLHDPSFQLSFLATLGLILLASPIEKRLSFIPDKFGMRGTVASTFATQIFVSPFILYMMGQLSIIGVVVNILVLPFIPLTMLAVFLTGALGFISIGVSQVFALGAHVLLAYELFMVQSFAKVPFASIHLPIFSGWFVVAFYVIFMTLYGWFAFRRERKIQ